MNARRLRVLSLALVATFATAVMASSAAAEEGEFEADSYPVTFTGESVEEQDEFETVVGNLRCTVTYHGEAFEALPEMPLTTGHKECALEGAKATMTFLNCHTRFTAGETVEEESTVAVETHFMCNMGGSIVIEILEICTIRIEPNQSFEGGLAHNETTGEEKGDVRVELNFENVRYEVEGFCFAANGTYENGKYRGSATLEGEKPFLSTPKIGIQVT